METKLRVGTDRPTQEILLLGKSLQGSQKVNINMRIHLTRLLIDLGGLLHQVGLLGKPFLLMCKITTQKREETPPAHKEEYGLDQKSLRIKINQLKIKQVNKMKVLQSL